jgi:hypothetical protein
MHRLACDMQATNKRGYVINLDPAVMMLPFGANIDIRDTVRYKEVMKEYGLGPNGGILTSLNLFATKFDEVLFLVPSSILCVCVCVFYFMLEQLSLIGVAQSHSVSSGTDVVQRYTRMFPCLTE